MVLYRSTATRSQTVCIFYINAPAKNLKQILHKQEKDCKYNETILDLGSLGFIRSIPNVHGLFFQVFKEEQVCSNIKY